MGIKQYEARIKMRLKGDTVGLARHVPAESKK